MTFVISALLLRILISIENQQTSAAAVRDTTEMRLRKYLVRDQVTMVMGNGDVEVKMMVEIW